MKTNQYLEELRSQSVADLNAQLVEAKKELFNLRFQNAQGAGQQAHTEHGEEPHHQAVEALGAGDDLENHDLTELAGVLAQQAGAGLTGDAGALGGADAAEHSRQA